MSMLFSFLPTALKIAGWLIDKKRGADNKQKSWLELVEFVEKDLNVSVSLNEEDKRQRDQLRDMHDALFTKDEKEFADKEPERESKGPVAVGYKVPKIVEVDVEVKTKGNYKTESGQAKGLVVHYTAGRRSKGKADAEGNLKYLASKGLGCLVMDNKGVIYRAKNQALDEVAYHAGKSEWFEKSGVSQYCLGMEICTAGKLEKDGKTTWFGEKVDPKNIRTVKAKDNMAGGSYEAFTKLQEDSLKNFILWQKHVNPEFKIDWVVGHDECCLPAKRKSDPGGSLSMTMPAFREKLKKQV